MLYRIAIYRTENGKRVFDHYASDEEMENLKVSPDGKVWHYQIEEFIINPITGLPVYRIINTDFSDTHEVEWGCHLTSDPIYENDIILIHDGDGICYDVRDGVFPLMEFYTNYLVNGSPYCEIEVIGNIHEEEK